VARRTVRTGTGILRDGKGRQGGKIFWGNLKQKNGLPGLPVPEEGAINKRDFARGSLSQHRVRPKRKVINLNPGDATQHE